MSHWKLNILGALMALGIVGVLIALNHHISEFVSPALEMMSEPNIVPTVVGMILCTLSGTVYIIGSIIYKSMWWILAAVIIIRIYMYKSRRN